MSFSTADYLTAEIPEDWVHHRLKEIADVVPSNVDKLAEAGQPPVLLCNYVDTYKNEKITQSLELMAATATPAQIERLGLRIGDIAITKDSETPWDIAVPTLIADDIPSLVCGYHLARISPLKGRMDGGYLAWALRCKPVNLQFALAAQGITRYGLSASALADGVVPCPPFDQQKVIAAYLDRETARIDALMQAKTELVDALAELGRATAYELVTKGISPGASTKDSGVEWLPRVPAHWRVKRNMFLFNQRREPGYEGLPLLKVSLHTGVTEGDEDDESAPRVRRRMQDKSAYQIVRRGDVAYNMMRAWQGAIGAVPVDGLVSPAYVVLTPTEDLDPRFFELLARTASYVKEFERHSYGIASFRWRLYWEGFKEILTPVPPIGEQLAIVEAYDRERGRIAALREHVERELRLLAELRSATIEDAVLGRLDVSDGTRNSRGTEAVA